MTDNRSEPSLHPPATISGSGRVTAAFIAAVATGGFLLQFRATCAAVGSAILTVWVLAGYFTILANIVVAAVFAQVVVMLFPANGTTL